MSSMALMESLHGIGSGSRRIVAHRGAGQL